MTRKTIYFDNAASTFPKPEVVYQAADQYFRNAANPGRGAHSMAMTSATAVFETRNAVADLLGIKDVQRLVFTPGATYSINFALQGFPFKEGDVVLVTALEHNAVMRPLRWLEKTKGIVVKTLPYASKGIIDLHSFIQSMLELHPRLCVFTQGSNVTGEMIDVKAVAAICGAHKVPLMLDAAQTAGFTTERVDELGVSIWCASGHKGLYGAPGVGLLYTAPNVELEPTIFGGTGSRSESEDMPTAFPDRMEAGSLPGPAIAALGAGARWLKDIGIESVRAKEQTLADRFLNWTAQTQGFIPVAGNRASAGALATSTISFSMGDFGADMIAHTLDTEFGIAVRAGLHCAAHAHAALGTLDKGLVRVSFSVFNTEEEVDDLCRALYEIASRAPSPA
jgi:cysteine desulfurase / selenocysteine lyase